MSDQNEDSANKPRIIPVTTVAAPREPLLSETFEIHYNLTVDELIRQMARMANYMNLLTAEALRSRIVTAANPSTMAMMNAAANLEQGAQAQRQQLAMAAAGQFAAPGGGQGGPPGMPPFRMN